MIADFIRATESIPLYQLPAHLASFPKQWPFPRGDAYHWIPVFNRFDRILELFNQEYGLVEGPQTQHFQWRLLLKGDAEDGNTSAESSTTEAVLDTLHVSQDGDRELIEQLLNFTRMLLENCGNRSLYSSSERLDKLLNTTSTSLLKATLRLVTGCRSATRLHAYVWHRPHCTPHYSLVTTTLVWTRFRSCLHRFQRALQQLHQSLAHRRAKARTKLQAIDAMKQTGSVQLM
jgi:E3 ubiquitin-protein ligase HUWE1